MLVLRSIEEPLKLAHETDRRYSDCFRLFITFKSIKRLEILNKETKPPGKPTKRRYLAGLSMGPSSAALIPICEAAVVKSLSRNREEPFGLHVIHVDTELGYGGPLKPPHSTQLLERWRTRYPRFTFQSVPLASVLELKTIDWSSFGPQPADLEPLGQLRHLLEGLPSATSRADLSRLFIRHILLAAAIVNGCEALLLGCSTTALAELTLAETAKGRGFSLPWQISDGNVDAADVSMADPASSTDGEKTIPLYYPLRDVYRKELIAFGAVVIPPLADLVVQPAPKSGPVVSHKDLSIDEVMSRYFEDVEENYPSIVANVVRTTSKLERLGEGGKCCVCGNVLDEQGDDRWRGELGDDRGEAQGPASGGTLCYGCKRSVYG